MKEEEKKAIEEQRKVLQERGEEAYQSLLDYFKKCGYTPAKTDPAQLMVFVTSQGDDLPMPAIFHIIPEIGMISLNSQIPVRFPSERYTEASVAVNAINSNLSAGAFCILFSDGYIYFNISSFYADTGLSEDEIGLLLDIAFSIIDKYNDKFLALQNGTIDINTFLQKIKDRSF